MSEMQGIESPEAPPKPSWRERLSKVRTQASIWGLKGAERYLRARGLRMLAIQAVGACAVFHGIDLYSNRVAFIVLGVGVILAAERQ